MDAIMQALLGGDALTDDEKMRQTASALRDSDNAAQVFALSSIPDIAKAAQNQRSLISDAAKRGGILREGALRRKQQKDASDSALKLSMEQRLQDRKWQEADNAAKLQNALDVAKIKANKSGGGGDFVKSMPAAQQKGYVAAQQIIKDFPALIERVGQNEGAFGLEDNLTTMLPEKWTPNFVSKPLKAWEASKLSDEEEQAKTAVFKNAYDIIHELAGATLAMGEEDKISKFLPMPEDSVKTIQNKLRSAYAEAQKVNMNLENLYGGGQQTPVQNPTGQQAPEQVAEQQRAEPQVAGQQDMTPEQQKYWAELTPEQQAELIRLRRGQ